MSPGISVAVRVCVIASVVMAVNAEDLVCGELKAVTQQPPVKGAKYLLEFTKPEGTESFPMAATDVTWKYRTDSTFTYYYNIYDSNSQFTISQDESKSSYYLQINNPSESYYHIFASYSRQGKICTTFVKRIDFQEVEGCGLLYSRTDPIVEDKPFTVAFIPSPSLNSSQRSQLTWQTCTGNGSLPCVWRDVDPSNNFSKTYDGKEYFLQSSNADRLIKQISMTCGMEGEETVPLKVSMTVKPTPPVFKDARYIDDTCTACIATTEGQDADITCITGGGTGPITIRLLHGGSEKTGCKTDRRGTFPRNTVTQTCSVKGQPGNHMTRFTCEVSNSALQDSFLSAETDLYVTVPASRPYITIGELTEGETANVTCVSEGRPAPEMRMFLAGENVTFSRHETELHWDKIQVTGVYDQIVTRKDGNKKLKCCVKDVGSDTEQCIRKDLHVLYPPANVSLTMSLVSEFNADDVYDIGLTCRLVQSNPACNVTWTGVTTTSGLEEGEVITSGSDGNVSQTLLLRNQSRVDHGQRVFCQPQCSHFRSLEMSDFVILNVPFAPMVTVSPTVQTVRAGDDAVFFCKVVGNPASSVVWLDGNNNTVNGIVTTDKGWELHIENSNTNNTGAYRCVVDNGFHPEVHALASLNVAEAFVPGTGDDAEQRVDEETGDGFPSLWVALAIVVAIAAIIVIVIAVVMKRRKRNQDKTDISDSSAKQLDTVALNSKDKETGKTNQSQIYYNVEMPNQVAVPPADDDPVEYAVAVPKAQRESAKPNSTQGTEMIYADLDLENTSGSSSRPVKRLESQTEYVTIDFTKKAAPLAEPDTDG